MRVKFLVQERNTMTPANLFQNESTCETIEMKMTLICMKMDVKVNGFARRLVLKQRQRVTRKWPIAIYVMLY